MKIKLSFFIVLASFILFTPSCKQKNSVDENLAPGVRKVKVEEVIQTSSYTYLRVTAQDQENWIAIAAADVKVGKDYYYIPGIEMKDFASKELNRTFPSIGFVDIFSDQPIISKLNPADSLKGKQAPTQKEGIKVEPVKGGITIAQLYSAKEKYDGKTVVLRGEVVKFSPQIMNTNWVHIQDGTNHEGAFDLTVTTGEVLKVGDIVTLEGTVSLKKDFGAGYFYEVIVEGAKIVRSM